MNRFWVMKAVRRSIAPDLEVLPDPWMVRQPIAAPSGAALFAADSGGGGGLVLPAPWIYQGAWNPYGGAYLSEVCPEFEAALAASNMVAVYVAATARGDLWIDYQQTPLRVWAPDPGPDSERRVNPALFIGPADRAWGLVVRRHGSYRRFTFRHVYALNWEPQSSQFRIVCLPPEMAARFFSRLRQKG